MIKSLTTTTTNHHPSRHPPQPLMGTNILLTLKIVQLRPTLWNPIDYKVHEILQARILQWVAIPFFSGSSQSRDRIRDRTQVSRITGGFFFFFFIFSFIFISWRLITLQYCRQADSLSAEPQGKPSQQQ